MPREERVQYEGAFYHVMSRGNDKKKVFVNDEDRWHFLRLLSMIVKEYRWRCHAYCLMGNHYHLFLETPDANLSAGMQQLNGRYGQCFNSKHNRVGHVLQGRFKSNIVEDDRYLYRLLRYVCLNPVKDGFASTPENWRWSSYSAIAGLTRVPAFLETSFTLALFSDDPQHARDEYRSFIKEGMRDPHEITDRDRLLEFLFEGAFEKRERDTATRLAHDEYGFGVNEISTFLGVNRITVSRALHKPT